MDWETKEEAPGIIDQLKEKLGEPDQPLEEVTFKQVRDYFKAEFDPKKNKDNVQYIFDK